MPFNPGAAQTADTAVSSQTRRQVLRLSAWALPAVFMTLPAWSAALDDDRAWLERLSWGGTPQSLAELQRKGRTAWLNEQLRAGPPAPMPSAVQQQIDALTISSEPFGALVARLEPLRQEHKIGVRAGPRNRPVTMSDDDAGDADTSTMSPAAKREPLAKAYRAATNPLGQQAATRHLLRALWSPDQLREQMTWFWGNHFSVHAQGHHLPLFIGDYEERALRPLALGRFRDLLQAVVTHPAMLEYLNNDKNARGHINENLARELLELHTLGVDGGYSQTDVQQLARVLTGLGLRSFDPRKPEANPPGLVRFADGVAQFNPQRHERGDKQLLGTRIASGGFDEITQVLDLLARHPSTARYVSRKLARFFVADEPPPALVERMAKRFLDSDGDIAAVLRQMIDSPEFNASLGSKFKDPVHYLVSALRVSFPEPRVVVQPIALQRWLASMGQALYGRPTPDGYPMVASAWNGSGQLATRFDLAATWGQGARALWGDSPQPPASALSQPAVRQALAGPLSPRTRAVLADAPAGDEWNTLFLASPEFMKR